MYSSIVEDVGRANTSPGNSLGSSVTTKASLNNAMYLLLIVFVGFGSPFLSPTDTALAD